MKDCKIIIVRVKIININQILAEIDFPDPSLPPDKHASERVSAPIFREVERC